MFIGENLQNLRLMNGYSRRQLSRMLTDVSEQSIWQYENNDTTPNFHEINELKSIFNVKGTYFFNEETVEKYKSCEHNISLMNIAYRSDTINVITKTQSEVMHMEYLDSFVNYLTKDLVVPYEPIINLRDKCVKYLNRETHPREEQIKYIADLARNFLGLENSSNNDLMYLLEKSGIFIFEKQIGQAIDAYSLWTESNRPYIMLGNLKRSAVRRNFDLAHELGHLLLHYKVEFTNLDEEEYKEVEREANMFASFFLLPEQSFIKDFKLIRSKTDPDEYINMKEKWKVSIQVLGYRAIFSGLLSAKEHRHFYANLHRKKYLKREPLDHLLTIQQPQKIKSIFHFVFKENVINFHKMLTEDWLIEVEFLQRLTGIDVHFFEKYNIKSSLQNGKRIEVLHQSHLS